MKIEVYNLLSGQVFTFIGITAIDALISCAILADKKAGDLTNLYVRDNYKLKIKYGNQSASIGGLTIKLENN